MTDYKHKEKKTRNRSRGVKRWSLTDETNIINFLKQNRDFEFPTARTFYTKFMEEHGMNIYWKLCSYKVRNMRIVYRRAKEYQLNKKDCNETDEEVRNIMLKICWYLDDFDILFPNEMDNYPKPTPKESSSDDESSNQESVSINDNLNNTSTEQVMQEQPTTSYLPKSIERDILAVQTGKFNYKRQKFDEDISTKQQELEMAKEKLMFEKDKFGEEIRLKEKEIDSRERLKIMELEMKERIAMRELELKEKVALQSIEKQKLSYNNVYHSME